MKIKVGQFVQLAHRAGTNPVSGIWAVTKAGKYPEVFAPCRCCGEINSWTCEAEQIVKVAKKPRLASRAIILGKKRSDGYWFYLTKKRGRAIVNAGCRHFSFDDAREHWQRTRGGTSLGRWTLRELSRLRKLATQAGWR